MSRSRPKRLAVAVIAAATIAVSVAASAGLFPGTSVHVDASDLDLTTRPGLVTFYNRLQDAAMKFCDPSGSSKVLPYFNRPESGDCFSDTLYIMLTKYDDISLRQIHDDLRLEPIIIE